MDDWKIVSLYTTKEAVADGTLVSVADGQSKECGIIYPVYMTRSVWEKYVEVPAALQNMQDLKGRLWDILWMFMLSAKKCTSSLLEFNFICQIPDAGNWEPHERNSGLDRQFRSVKLKAVITAQDFDDPSPAIFIMKPSED